MWRLEDGSQVAIIREPFEKAPIVSFGLRPGWSPDGQTLALPNGYDKGMHTVPLIKRNRWGSKCRVEVQEDTKERGRDEGSWRGGGCRRGVQLWSAGVSTSFLADESRPAKPHAD